MTNESMAKALLGTAEFVSTISAKLDACSVTAELNGATGGTTVTVDCLGNGPLSDREECMYKLEFRSIGDPDLFIYDYDNQTWETL